MSRLDGLHPQFREKLEALQKICAAAKIPIVWTQGLRTIEQQDALYAQGRTTAGPIVTNAKGGTSYHNYGLAADFAVKKDGKLSWEDKVDVDADGEPDYREVGEIGESLGLEWGGRWKKPDLPHFQLTFGLSIAQLQAGERPEIVTQRVPIVGPVTA